MSYTGTRGTNPDRDAARADRVVRAPGSGGSGRNGGGRSGDDDGPRNLWGVGSFLVDLNRGFTDINRSQGQYWQSAGRAAQQEGRYYQQAGRRDGARAAYGDSLYAQTEYGRAAQQASRYSGGRDDRRDDRRDERRDERPAYDRQQQGYGQGQQGSYGQSYTPQGGIPNYYGNGNPYVQAQRPAVTPVPTGPSQQELEAQARAAAQAQTRAAAEAQAQTGIPASPPSPATTTTGEAPATVQPAATPPTPTTPLALSASTGAAATPMRLRAQPAPQGLNLGSDQVEGLQRMMSEVPELRAMLATSRQPDGVDGKYGPNTFTAIQFVASRAEPAITDLNSINFRDPNDPETQRFMASLQQLRTPTPTPTVAPAQTGPTPEQLALAESQRQWQQNGEQLNGLQAAERARPTIVVDLPNDMRSTASIRNLVGLRTMRGDDGERIEFSGPDGPHSRILDDYVNHVRNVMTERGLNPSRGDAREAAALMLAAYNNISVTDSVNDLQRLRLPSAADIEAGIDTMRTNVLIDGNISGRELRLDAGSVQQVVFAGRQAPPNAQMIAAMLQAHQLAMPQGVTVQDSASAQAVTPDAALPTTPISGGVDTAGPDGSAAVIPNAASPTAPVRTP